MDPSALRPQRYSLLTETVRALRTAIEAGQWQEYLPAERRLCEEWQISRPTLRAAIAELAREGVVAVSHGSRTRVLREGKKEVPSALTVGLLSPEPLHAMPPFVLLWLDELRGQLAAEGHRLQVHVGRAEFGRKNPAKALASLVESFPCSAWILFQTTEAMQRWFAEQTMRSVVVGSLFPGVQLPAVDCDYRAVCRHAVGLLASRGHRRVAMLIHEPQFGGDRESEAGFQEGLLAAERRGVTGRVWHHNGSAKSIGLQIDRMLAQAGRPTAVVVARTAYALTAFSHLLRKGLRIPEDVALLCRDDDTFLDHVAPRVTRYAVNPAAFVKQVFRLVQQTQIKKGITVMPSLLMRESI